MKKALLFISIFALMLAACTSKPPMEKAAQMPAYDTAGLASFQEWKLMNERADMAKFEAQKEEQPEAAPVYKAKAPVRKAKKVTPVQTQTDDNTGNSNTGATQTDDGAVVNTGNTDNGTSGSTGETQEPAKEEKKGISNAAKGTAIGAAGGAVLGAVISKKNKVLGGVIGGVIGGGIGYGIGRKMDKKQGR
jgi:hypothetical protein